MPTDFDQPEPEHPQEAAASKRPRASKWRRIFRIWKQRGLGRTATIVLAILLIPVIAGLATLGYFYLHYSNTIDAQLQGGPFRDSVNIYAAPVVLNDGDGVRAADIEAQLRLVGYRPENSGHPGTFETTRAGIDIVPVAGIGGPAVHVSVTPAGEIQRIDQNGKDVKTFAAGYPLMENLSSGRERRHMITFQDLPPQLVNAVVSVEDKHFFHHRGLDLPRVVKAAYIDVRQRRKEQGASTLTMQLVRGLWLQPEKNWRRKVAEAMMTIHLERRWSKEEIFTAYSNMVFLGRSQAYSVHGFAEASQLFFGKEVRQLSLPEAALLAGMVQRPSYFNPYRNPEHAKERRDLVLALMRDNKYISASEYQAAVDTPVKVVSASQQSDSFGAPYFVDLVSDELQTIDQPEDGAKGVYTTIDLNLQRAAAEAISVGMAEVDKQLAKRDAKSGHHAEAALIALDPHTGEVKAMIGGRDYSKSQLNRLLSMRPPGSVFKPFVYAAAMNTGIDGGNPVLTPASTVNDAPTTFKFEGRTYQPANFKHESFGTLTLRQALAKSDNVAAVKVAQEVGYGNVVAMARRAGLNADIKATPAVALGSYAVTPFEMAGAYTAFANGGMWMKPQLVSRVQNTGGETIHNEQAETHQAMDPRVAYLMVSMLEEVMKTGTAAGVRSRGFTLPAAGKTGTSHDGWFAGFTSQLLCIVWVGYDDYQELDLEGAQVGTADLDRVHEACFKTRRLPQCA